MINWSKVSELCEEVGAEDFDEVVELFLEEVEETLGELGNAGRSPEHDLHFLKGAALNLGFDAFSALCKDGEAHAASGGTDFDFATIKSTYATSRAMFLSEFRERLAS